MHQTLSVSFLTPLSLKYSTFKIITAKYSLVKLNPGNFLPGKPRLDRHLKDTKM
jgi:hypothetical protein